MLGTVSPGGISAVVDAYRAAGLFDRWAVRYIATHEQGPSLSKLTTAGWALGRFAGLLLAGRVALVHVHMAFGASVWRKGVFVLLALLARRPVVTHVHGSDFVEFYTQGCGPVGKWLVRRLLERSDAVVALSSQWVASVHGIAGAAPVRRIWNPVVLGESPPRSRRGRDEAVLLFLGTLGERKGVYELLESLGALAREFPSLRLRCGGDGEIERVRRRASELGLAERVELLGWVTGAEKQRLLDEAAVFVLPSHREGLPIALLEAMSAGLPVVSTNVGGIPDAVRDGEEGLLVAPGDVPALTAAVARLLRDPALGRRLGAAARQRVERCFRAERIVTELESLYRSLGASPIDTDAAPAGSRTQR